MSDKNLKAAEIIGANIRARVDELGWNDEKGRGGITRLHEACAKYVGEMDGMTYKTLREIYHGRRKPNGATLFLISKVLKTSVKKLLEE